MESISIQMRRIHEYFQTSGLIQRVNNQLRMVNEKDYEPEIVAIGPYHRNKRNLKMMEKHKVYYLKSILERRGDQSLEVYFEAVRQLEDQARKCFADELPELTSDQFVAMLVLDGCFIIELLRRFDMIADLNDTNDLIFKLEWIFVRLQRDLLLFENQIPFCVLFKLFTMIEEPNQNKDLIRLASRFFDVLFPGFGYPARYVDENWHEEVIHLLGLIRENWLPVFATKEPTADNRENRTLIRRATELRKAGVMFEMADKGEVMHLYSIRFKDGKIQIPRIVIEDRTECFLRNLIAYEQHYRYIGHRYVGSYVKFLNCLIKSPRDVELLCRSGVIHSLLNDEAVSQIFNRITDSIPDPGIHFHYIDIFNEVNAHCGRRRNRWMAILKEWMAILRHEHLHTPWKFISVLAASLLLLMTLVQAIFAVLSYKKAI